MWCDEPRGFPRASALLGELRATFGKSVHLACACLNQVAMTVPTDLLLTTVRALQENRRFLFTQLIDITAVDMLTYTPGPQSSTSSRFQVVYFLLSMPYNMRIQLVCNISQEDSIPSIVEVFPVANWYEREVWDMFGIPFTNHPDLRRLLTDDGFEGYPLRKDFPVYGTYEVHYDTHTSSVVRTDVDLPVAFRSFDFSAPWKGYPDGLPGDEKAILHHKEENQT
ncbi:MAG: NADH-quinone oxidoreductase subunit C [Alphaproteobacteria bacterium]|nr:MAG: NADH-quinone oxidoreductase subunit C [Alphaproteobacteria bacterium]